MALTRPRFGQLNTGVVSEADPITVLHAGATSANVDIGFLMNRANGLVSNVALYWNEAGNTFATSFTTSTGGTDTNVAVTSYANITTGSHTVYGAILPSANITYDLGSPSLRFRTLYLSGSTIDLGGALISAVNGTMTLTNQSGGSFTVSGSAPGQSTGTFGNVVANSSVTSTSTSTGALQVAGGAGITGNVYSGAQVQAANGLYSVGSFNGGYSDGIVVDYTSGLGRVSVGLADAIKFYNNGPEGAELFVISAGGNIIIPVTTTSSSTTTGALVVSGGTGISGNIFAGGNITQAGYHVINSNVSVSALQITGTATKGGAGYHDFLSVTNQGGGTNINKYFRLSSTGGLEIINSAYNQNIFTLTDAGALTVPAISVGGSLGSSGQVLSSTGTGLQWVASGGFSGGGVPNQTTFASNVVANSGTSSTSSTTGALVVVGGIGASGNVWAGQVYTTNNGNGTNFAVGDDAWIGDINAANTMGIKGQQDPTQGYIVFGNANNTNYIGRNGSNPITVTGAFNVTSDLTVTGNIYASYLNTVSSSQLSVTSPLVYLTGQPYPYTYDIGLYSHFIGGPANVYSHTGAIRSYSNNYWGFFSNVKTEPAGSVNWADPGLIWDTVKAGALVLANVSGTVLTVSGNTAINSTMYAQGVYDNSVRVVSTSSGAGNLTISAGAITLPATGPGATTVGSSTSIPVITTDAYGRITALTSSSVSTTINLSGTTGTGTVAGGGTLTFAGSNGVTATVSSSTITIGIPQAIATTSTPTFAGATVNGTIVATTLNASTIGNISANIVGTGTYLTSLNASNLSSGTIASGILGNSTLYVGTTAIALNRASAGLVLTGITSIDGAAPAGSLSGSTLASGVTASSLTSVGTLTSLAVTGTTTRGSKALITNYTGTTAPSSPQQGDEWWYTTGNTLYKYIYDGTGYSWVNITPSLFNAATAATANTLALRDSGGNLTATNFIGVASSAKYADLAEIYVPDSHYEPGTVVVFGGTHEITITNKSHDSSVAGVISTNPAYLMNSECVGLPVAFTGRVPCQVQGPIKKGQLLVTSNKPGVAQAIDNTQFVPGCVIGKSLEDITTKEITTIEVVVGRF